MIVVYATISVLADVNENIFDSQLQNKCHFVAIR